MRCDKGVEEFPLMGEQNDPKKIDFLEVGASIDFVQVKRFLWKLLHLMIFFKTDYPNIFMELSEELT